MSKIDEFVKSLTEGKPIAEIYERDLQSDLNALLLSLYGDLLKAKGFDWHGGRVSLNRVRSVFESYGVTFPEDGKTVRLWDNSSDEVL